MGARSSGLPSASTGVQAYPAIFWSAVQTIGVRVLTFGVFIVLARLLSPADFGLVASAGAILLLMDVLSDQGLLTALVQKKVLSPEDIDSAFWFSFGAATIAAAGISAASGLVARTFGDTRLQLLICILSITMPVGVWCRLYESILQRDLRLRGIALRGLVSAIAGGAAAIALASLGMGVWSLVVKQFVEVLTSLFVLRALSAWRPRLRFSWNSVTKMLPFGTGIMGYRMVDFLHGRLDNLIIAGALGATPLGYFNMGQRLHQVALEGFTTTVHRVVFPKLSQLQTEHIEYARFFLQAVRLTAFVAVPTFAYLAVMGDLLISLLLGRKWEAASGVFRILCLGGMITSFSYLDSAAFLSRAKSMQLFWLVAVSGVLNLCGYLMFVSYGIAAIAVVFVVRGLLISPLLLVLTSRVVGIGTSDYLRQVSKPLLGSLLGIMLLILVKPLVKETSALVELCVTGIMFSLSYLAWAALADRKTLRRLSNVVIGLMDAKAASRSRCPGRHG